MIPTLIGMTLVLFVIMAASPGGVGASLRSAEGNMRPEQRREIEAYLKHRYGLDQPLYRQYLRWLNHVSPIGFKDVGPGWPASLPFGFKAVDLGESLQRRTSVLSLVEEALPVTLLLNVLSTPLIYVIAVTSGIYAARRRGAFMDMASGVTLIALWSLPVMCVGVLMLGYLANKDYWQSFPVGGLHDTVSDSMAFLPHWIGGHFQRGWLLDTLWHLVLPVVCLSYGGFAFLSKLMRAAMLENLAADFARTARAKGLKENVVVMRHVLRNSILPLITVGASVLPSLLGGALIVESIFSINGMGRLMIDAIFAKDQELVMSETYVIGIVSLLSLLVADLCYALADPRVSYE